MGSLASVVPSRPAEPAKLAVSRLQSPTVAGERVKLAVAGREILGSAEARRLRKRGLIPGVLYGRDDPVAISVPARDLRSALTTRGPRV